MKSLLSLLSIFAAIGCSTAPATVTDISPDQFLASTPDTALILDVRSEAEFSSGHVPHAVNISHEALLARIGELGDDTSRPVVVYCESGRRAAIASAVLLEHGFTDVRHLTGDMKDWRDSKRPIEN